MNGCPWTNMQIGKIPDIVPICREMKSEVPPVIGRFGVHDTFDGIWSKRKNRRGHNRYLTSRIYAMCECRGEHKVLWGG